MLQKVFLIPLSLLVAPMGIFAEALYWSCCQVSTGAIVHLLRTTPGSLSVHDCKVMSIQRKQPLFHT